MSKSMKERLRETLAEAIEKLQWCTGSADFGPGGQAEEGWNKGPAKLIEKAEKLLEEVKPEEEVWSLSRPNDPNDFGYLPRPHGIRLIPHSGRWGMERGAPVPADLDEMDFAIRALVRMPGEKSSMLAPVGPLWMERVNGGEGGERLPHNQSDLTLDGDGLRDLMDSLWRMGVRPSSPNHQEIDATVSAQRAHLNALETAGEWQRGLVDKMIANMIDEDDD